MRAMVLPAVGLIDLATATAKLLREMAVSVLNEIKDLPSKVLDPHWLDTFDEADKEAKAKK
jgi:hypothetical protein